MSRRSTLSVIVPTYLGRKFIEGCLKSHSRQRHRDGVEWIVTVSGEDGTADWIARNYPWVHLVRSASRVNASEARNLGVEAARGDWFAFTDVDVLVPPAWTERIFRRIEAGAAAFCGTVRNGTPRSPVGTADYFLCFGEYIPGPRSVPGRRRLIGANFIVSREAWNAAGPMDASLPRGQDTEYGNRLRNSGFPPTLFGEIEVTHLNRTDREAFLACQATYGRTAAKLRLRGDASLSLVARCPALIPLIPLYRIGVLALRILRNRPAEILALLASARELVSGLAAYTRAFREEVLRQRASPAGR